MQNARPPHGHILLKNLLPPTVRETPARKGHELLSRQVPTLRAVLSAAQRKGLVTADQIEEVTKELEEVVAFFLDLSKRERKAINEEVTNPSVMTDGNLEYQWNDQFYSLCGYLDSLREVLFRLRNHGHVSDDQFRWMVRYFDALREMHREVFEYLDRLYL